MLSFLPAPVRGVLSFLLYVANSIIIVVPIVLIAVIKLVIPFEFWQVISRKILDILATTWIDINSFNMWLFQQMDLEITGTETLQKDYWYLVISNHQTWVDILLLQKSLNRKR